jgi:hypothetical protein
VTARVAAGVEQVMAKKEDRQVFEDLAAYYAAMAEKAGPGKGREHAKGVADYYAGQAKKGGK